jgi:hypothetical protein
MCAGERKLRDRGNKGQVAISYGGAISHRMTRDDSNTHPLFVAHITGSVCQGHGHCRRGVYGARAVPDHVMAPRPRHCGARDGVTARHAPKREDSGVCNWLPVEGVLHGNVCYFGLFLQPMDSSLSKIPPVPF